MKADPNGFLRGVILSRRLFFFFGVLVESRRGVLEDRVDLEDLVEVLDIFGVASTRAESREVKLVSCFDLFKLLFLNNKTEELDKHTNYALCRAEFEVSKDLCSF